MNDYKKDDIAKIKMKLGNNLEIEYAGNPAGIEGRALAFVKRARGAFADFTATAPQSSSLPSTVTTGESTPTGSYTTAQLADILDAKSGAKLAICALAKFALNQEKTMATAEEIQTEMETVNGVYIDSHGDNLVRDLGRMSKNKKSTPRVIKRGDKYQLSKPELEKIKAKIKEKLDESQPA